MANEKTAPTKLTQNGLEELQSKHKELVTKRGEIAERLDEARKQGDLSENSEYDEAKEAQTLNEQEIKRIEAILKNYVIVEEANTVDKVHVGLDVVIRDEEFDEEESYHIVSSTEADPMNGKISIESPVGIAIMGHKKGDTVTVEVNGNKMEYTIVDIKLHEKK